MAEIVGTITNLSDFLSKTQVCLSVKPNDPQQQIICLEADRKYSIPAFQREVRWDDNNLKMLLYDLSRSSKFLGNIILTIKSDHTCEIIDGQQRTTVLMHNDIPNAYVYNPITEIPNDLVWEFLLKGDCRSPWGSDMKYLFSLYQGENLGEEKSVLGEVDREKIPVTGNSRFGCWCCTMVKEDKSLQNFINKGATELIPLREFRNELLRMRENSQYRDSKRRNGSVYKKSDGSFGMGPFTLEARCLILEKLLDLENRTGMELITEAELKAIDKMWDEEGDLTCRALVETYHKVKGKKLPWDDYKTPRFDDEAIQAIRDVADTLTLLLFGAEDEQLSTLNGGVIVQSGELEGDSCVTGTLTAFDFLPAFIDHIFIGRDIIGCRKLHHHIVKHLIDFLLDVLSRRLCTQLLAFL